MLFCSVIVCNTLSNHTAKATSLHTHTHTRTHTRTHTHTHTHTHRTIQDGVKTVIILENGELVSKTVDGQPVAIEGRSQQNPAIDTTSKKRKSKSKR